MKKIILITSTLLLLAGCQKSTDKVVEESSETSISSQISTEASIVESEENKMTFEQGSLIQAVTNQQTDKVKEILQDKTYNVNEVNDKNESALLIATHNNQVEIAKLLIDGGADVNQQDSISDSPYLYAGAQGKTEILAYMLEKTQPNQQIYNRFGGNALIPAAEKGHLENVKLLLNDGQVDIDHQNNYGYTALIEAVALTDGSQIYQDIVTELLNHQANKDLKDNSGKTAMDYAKELGYGKIEKILYNENN